VLEFSDAPGLRPTPDRVRETLFNWLQPLLPASHCLDLFAGTGALGFEALSRGATSVTLVEQAPAVAAQLRANAQRLAATNAQVVERDALSFLKQPVKRPFDIVFLDPPFHQGLVDRAIEALSRPGVLAPAAFVYVETGADEPEPQAPPGWSLHRDKRAGQVAYRLFRVEAPISP
jgi:16S rRNA (guanine966-N2)-methyltransferase